MKHHVGFAAFLVSALIVSGITFGAEKKPKPTRKRPPDIRLKVGQAAPDFSIYRLDDALKMEEKKRKAPGEDSAKPGEKLPKKIRLYDFRGKKPVFLIFSSYT